MLNHAAAALTLTTLVACSTLGVAGSQPPPRQRPPREVPFRLVSAEIMRFKPAIRAGEGARGAGYDQALVLTLRVNRDQYDALPPNIEPFLYVGSYEMRTFRIDRPEGSRELTLVFHARDWNRLQDGAPMVLTTDHGAPVREPRRFAAAPRFARSTIVDRRLP